MEDYLCSIHSFLPDAMHIACETNHSLGNGSTLDLGLDPGIVGRDTPQSLSKRMKWLKGLNHLFA
jgi:hypothetical protein